MRIDFAKNDRFDVEEGGSDDGMSLQYEKIINQGLRTICVPMISEGRTKQSGFKAYGEQNMSTGGNAVQTHGQFLIGSERTTGD